MQKWEYRTETSDNLGFLEYWQEKYGDEGWQFVTVMKADPTKPDAEHSVYWFYFQRLKTEEQK